jgi:hypothetical protein
VYTITTYRWSDDASDLPLSFSLSYYALTPSNLLLLKGNTMLLCYYVIVF